ncbi:MAG: response regulator transcription factor, partial [Dehalococcoidia bacterium]
MPLRILIVDDHRLARDAVRTAVGFCRSGQPDIVGEAADGATAIELARRLKPDVITMDIGLPDMMGLEVTRRLKAEMPQVKVVVVTVHKDREYQEEAVKAGAVSYITKEHLIHELPSCLDHLAGQRSVWDAE